MIARWRGRRRRRRNDAWRLKYYADPLAYHWGRWVMRPEVHRAIFGDPTVVMR